MLMLPLKAATWSVENRSECPFRRRQPAALALESHGRHAAAVGNAPCLHTGPLAPVGHSINSNYDGAASGVAADWLIPQVRLHFEFPIGRDYQESGAPIDTV
jgi:hypothetical protein